MKLLLPLVIIVGIVLVAGCVSEADYKQSPWTCSIGLAVARNSGLSEVDAAKYLCMNFCGQSSLDYSGDYKCSQDKLLCGCVAAK